jgi:alpha-tubulin suppressor-like RCC1 family protein
VSGALGLAVGGGHACAITGTNTVLCWGNDFFGQLGDQATMPMPSGIPVPVKGLTGIDQIASHYDFTCAHAQTGGVSCWGRGGDGQIGAGSYQNANSTALSAGVANATKVVTGGAHTCAIVGTGHMVECWGASYLGQVGDGGYDNHSTPAAIAGIAGVTDLAAGGEHTCALVDAGGVMCWGDDRDGELGDGIAARQVPVAPLLPCP